MGDALKELRLNLPRGAMTEIAEKLGVRRETVWQVLNGRTTSPRIIDAALEWLADYKKEQKNRANKIRKILED